MCRVIGLAFLRRGCRISCTNKNSTLLAQGVRLVHFGICNTYTRQLCRCIALQVARAGCDRRQAADRLSWRSPDARGVVCRACARRRRGWQSVSIGRAAEDVRSEVAEDVLLVVETMAVLNNVLVGVDHLKVLRFDISGKIWCKQSPRLHARIRPLVLHRPAGVERESAPRQEQVGLLLAEGGLSQ